jgi:ABC-type transporter Mla MlaB component
MMHVFKPSQAMTFETVMSDQQKLRAFLQAMPRNSQTKSSWVLDLAEVEHYDSAGVALLMEAMRLSYGAQLVCEVRGMSRPLHDLIDFLGVRAVFDEFDVFKGQDVNM